MSIERSCKRKFLTRFNEFFTFRTNWSGRLPLHKMLRWRRRHPRCNRRRIRNRLQCWWRRDGWIHCDWRWWLNRNRTVFLNSRAQRLDWTDKNAVFKLENLLIFRVSDLPRNIENSLSARISLITFQITITKAIAKPYLSEETWPTIDSFGGMFHNVQPLKSRSKMFLSLSSRSFLANLQEEVKFSAPKKDPISAARCYSADLQG